MTSIAPGDVLSTARTDRVRNLSIRVASRLNGSADLIQQ
jgi:hypothetical protein